MKFRRFYLLIITTVITAQSPYNAIGHGIIMDAPDAASLGFSSSGLIPSMDSRFSPTNPTTWTDLLFTYLTGHYNTQDITSGTYRSVFGSLSSAIFVLPVKGEYAIGLGMAPISRRVFNLAGDTTIVEFSGDTLTISRILDGSGGISTMFMGGAWNVSENHTIGTRLDFLFGIHDEHIISHIDFRSSDYVRRFGYKGTFLSAYYRFVSDLKDRPISAFASLQIPFGGHYMTRTDFFEFIEPDPQPKTDLLLPTTGSIGAIYKLSPALYAGAEVVLRYFDTVDNKDFNSLEGNLGSANRISAGLTREKVLGSRDWFNRFHYRVGFFRRSHYIRGLEDSLIETGFSFGFGVPFGLTQNQVDFGFRISQRDGFLSDTAESITQFSVGLTIGDLWLLKGKRR